MCKWPCCCGLHVAHANSTVHPMMKQLIPTQGLRRSPAGQRSTIVPVAHRVAFANHFTLIPIRAAFQNKPLNLQVAYVISLMQIGKQDATTTLVPGPLCQDSRRLKLDVGAGADGEQNDRKKGFKVKKSRHAWGVVNDLNPPSCSCFKI